GKAVRGGAVAGGGSGRGASTALPTRRAGQAGDLASFRSSAPPQESWALTETLARPPARQAQAVEQRATAAGDGVLALGPHAGQQGSARMSYTGGWMGRAQQQVAGWVTAAARAPQTDA